jgi:uncharacterized membrane protein
MDSNIAIILVIHIVGGGLSMLTGFTNMALKKGTLIHKRVGDVYLVSLLATSFTSIILAVKINNSILSAIGIITLYLLVSGVRYLTLRKRVQNKRLKLNDWLPSILLFVYSMYLVIHSIVYFSQHSESKVYLLLLGIISLFMVWQDVSIFKGIVKKDNFHQTMHLQRMIPSFAALIISFLMVNAMFLPLWMSFFLPTVAMLPFIFIWTKKYSKIKLTDRMLH